MANKHYWRYSEDYVEKYWQTNILMAIFLIIGIGFGSTYSL